MSGVAGGERIQKDNVDATFEEYVDRVLSKIDGFVDARLSGSAKIKIKPDYGDLDLIVYFKGDDKREVKQRIIRFVNTAPESLIPKFKNPKHQNKKHYNAGELISVLFPIEGQPGEHVQVDNIIALTPDEQTFKESFLDMPAEIQGLLVGLAKTFFLEEPKHHIFRRLGINRVPALKEGQEYEFNLSGNRLELRIVTLGEDYKELDRKSVWSTTNWELVKKLFSNYDINAPFEKLLHAININLRNPRSKRRVVGTFKGLVSVKSGEVNTPKGDNKERSRELVSTVLGEQYILSFKDFRKGA